MAANIEPLPGTSDIWEPETLEWIELEQAARDVFHRYGYGEIRTPIFERTEVFEKNLGEESDVVQKEMYTFQDRGGRSLTLRPEGTAGVIRAIANSGLDQGDERRVFYFGPMFRGERPAAGRRRQFHQIGVESVGTNNPWMDVEVISMLVRFLDKIRNEQSVDGRRSDFDAGPFSGQDRPEGLPCEHQHERAARGSSAGDHRPEGILRTENQ